MLKVEAFPFLILHSPLALLKATQLTASRTPLCSSFSFCSFYVLYITENRGKSLTICFFLLFFLFSYYHGKSQQKFDDLFVGSDFVLLRFQYHLKSGQKFDDLCLGWVQIQVIQDDSFFILFWFLTIQNFFFKKRISLFEYSTFKLSQFDNLGVGLPQVLNQSILIGPVLCLMDQLLLINNVRSPAACQFLFLRIVSEKRRVDTLISFQFPYLTGGVSR